MATMAPAKEATLDANRIGNKIAVLGLVVFWVWFCAYLVLQYVPFGGYNAPDGPTYTYSALWSKWAETVSSCVNRDQSTNA
jgi:hypothetical protein